MDENTTKIEDPITHFTLITVSSKSPLYVDDGKFLYMKYLPVCFTSNEIKNVALARWLSQTEFIPTTMSEALKAFEVEDIASTVLMLVMSAKANHATIHCFKTEFPLTEEDCDSLVASANFDPYMKKKFLESRIV